MSKIKINVIDNNKEKDCSHEILTLAECGFVPGDVVDGAEIDDRGIAWVACIRATDYVAIGNTVSVQPGEFDLLEDSE